MRKKIEIRRDGNVVTFAMKCGDPKEIQMDMLAVYTFLSPKHYSGTLKSTVFLQGKKSTADKAVDSVWLGVCKQ